MQHNHSMHKHGGDKHSHHEEHDHIAHHEMMIEDFKKRFYVSIAVTLPILILSPIIQEWFGFKVEFYGSSYVLFLLASFLFFYGGWPFLTGLFDELKKKSPGMMTLIALAIERMATVMVITCPHALGLAIPLVVAMSTSLSAKNGLLIKNRTAFENARNISIVVFDKTGTLTEGKFGVSSVKSSDPSYGENEIIQFASALEKSSEHPIARGILERAQELGISVPDVSDFEAIKGKGVQGIVDGKKVKVVSPGYLKEAGIDIPDHAKDEQLTVVFVLKDEKIIGTISLSDRIREDSYEAIQKLKELGIKCWMLTGDNDQIAKKVHDELKLDGYFAEVLPHEKLEKVKELQSKN